MTSQITWQPISQLFALGQQIEAMIKDDKAQYELFRRASENPQLLKHIMIHHARMVYQAQYEEVTTFCDGQLSRWQRENLSQTQRQHLNRLSDRLAVLKELVEKILAALEEIQALPQADK